MKKSLIAIAALAAVGAASAQSSVTLYGLADTGLQYTRAKHGDLRASTFQATSGTLNGSRVGVKGAEDLGNGLKATFNYELGFNSANGNFLDNDEVGAGFGRKATVGLAGNFGHVRIGRDNTVVDNLVTATTADGQSNVDTATHMYSTGTHRALITARANGVHYDGNFAGLAVGAFVAPSKANTQGADFYVEEKNATGVTKKDRDVGYGLSVGYANGPLTAGVAAQQFREKTLTSKKAETQFVVGGAYDFNVAKVFANYIENSQKVGGVKQDKQQEANVGVTVPFGAASFVAEYGFNRVKPADGSKALKSHDGLIGANYAFSKRTDVYGRIGYQSILKASGDGTKGNAQTYAVGLRHRF